VNYFSFHIGDYAARTRYLAPMADLAYRRLLDLYYTLEGPIPAAGVAAEIGLEDNEADVLLVLRKFFIERDGMWVNTRCDEEIAKYQGKAERNREVGKLGGRPKKPTDNPDGFEKEPVGNPPKNQEPITNKEREPRATRLASGWELPADWGNWAAHARPDLDPLKTAERFADYWRAKPGKDGRKLDWEATWRNWVREERAPRVNPADVARQTTRPTETAEENRRRLDAMNPPLSPEQKAAADLVRQKVMASIKPIKAAA
jgi:uncharacterized protein YdaU (DUF1376 family)